MELGLNLGLGDKEEPAAAEEAAALPQLLTVDEDISNDSSSTSVNIASIPVVEGTTYYIESLIVVTSASTLDMGLNLSAPEGSTGVWSATCGIQASNDRMMRGAPIADAIVLTHASAANGEAFVHVRIKITAGADGTLLLRYTSPESGAIVVEAGSATVVREGETLQTAAEVSHSTAGTFSNVFTVTVAAGVKKWVDADLIYNAAASATGASWELSVTGDATFVAAVSCPSSSSTQMTTALRRDNTALTVAGSANTAINLCRMRVLIDGGAGGGTFKIGVGTEGDTSAITIQAGSFLREKIVTGLISLLAEDDPSTSTTPDTTLSFTLEASKRYKLSSLVGVTANATTAGLRHDIDGIPANGSALVCSASPNGPGLLGASRPVQRDGTDNVNASSGTAEYPWIADGVLNGGDGGTFTLRHGCEASSQTLTAKAGSFGIIEEVEVAA